MKKIIFILISCLLLTNCGYTPIFKSNSSNFYIEEITLNKKDKINRKIEKKLRIFSNSKSKNKIKISTSTDREKIIITKDKKGNPSRYEIKIITRLNLTFNNNQINEKLFFGSFNYKNDSNKFNLKQYESEIESILLDKIIEECLAYFSEIINDN